MLASQYAAPGERYEGQRRDWHAANFHSGSNVHIHIDTTTVELRIKKMLKTKQPLTINLTDMAPSFARFLIAYKQLINQSCMAYTLSSHTARSVLNTNAKPEECNVECVELKDPPKEGSLEHANGWRGGERPYTARYVGDGGAGFLNLDYGDAF